MKNIVKNILEKNPPQNINVTFTPSLGCDGWASKDIDEELGKVLESISVKNYNNSVGFVSSGGSIPIMGILQEKLPGCNVMATGILTSESNAHGPNEFLCTSTLRSFTHGVFELLTQL